MYLRLNDYIFMIIQQNNFAYAMNNFIALREQYYIQRY
jgi:hypothetical protein